MSAAELKVIEETAIAKVSQDSVSIYAQVQTLEVVDQSTYNRMIGLHEASKEVIKAVKAIHDPLCDHLHKMHRSATAAREKDLGNAELAKKLSKSKADDWWMEQERIRLEAERKLQEEARRKAEEDARIAREAAEAERRRLAAQEEEERLRLAAEAEALGATQAQVDEILDTPLAIPEPEPFIPEPVVLPTVTPTAQKAAGFSARWNYSAKGVDIMAMIRAAAVTPYLAECLQWNQSVINAKARSMKDTFEANVPGCKLVKERV